MSSTERSSALSELARLGFGHLDAAEELLAEVSAATGVQRDELVADSPLAADPDAALAGIARIARRDADAVGAVLRIGSARAALWALLGASSGFCDFYLRHPEELAFLEGAGLALPSAEQLLAELRDAVGVEVGFAATGDEAAWNALRVRYRRMLARIAAFDLLADDPVEILPRVAAVLADAAASAPASAKTPSPAGWKSPGPPPRPSGTTTSSATCSNTNGS